MPSVRKMYHEPTVRPSFSARFEPIASMSSSSNAVSLLTLRAILSDELHSTLPRLKWVLIVNSTPLLRIEPMLLRIEVSPVVACTGFE